MNINDVQIKLEQIQTNQDTNNYFIDDLTNFLDCEMLDKYDGCIDVEIINFISLDNESVIINLYIGHEQLLVKAFIK